MKKIIKLFAIILVIGGIYYSVSKYQVSKQQLINFARAKKEFATDNDARKFELRKTALQNYYLNGSYESDVKKITDKAKNYFSKIPAKSNSAVIFDVDDTAVYHYHRRPDTQFIWEKHPILNQARDRDKGTAIKPVIELYQFLKDKGFIIIFLTSRSDNGYDETLNELHKAGYLTFEKLILMPVKLAFDPTIKTADWKLEERKKLSQTYDIVGSVGDRYADFAGGFTGYKVRLPNYLY
jgi:predicted secreted acid phosphatase